MVERNKDIIVLFDVDGTLTKSRNVNYLSYLQKKY